ncbi:MAG: glycosyltransferase family 2 protein [Acholeplasmatales bacterium]|nr:glycosyltransferase family 2 protein [Acholeplasmatales bacterium]
MLEDLIRYGFYLFIVFIAFCIIAYIPRLRAWFYGFKKQKHLTKNKDNKIAIIIPARNESMVIGNLFDSIKEQTYKNFDVYVIVKDPKDETINMAKDINAYTLVLENQTKKSDALDYALKEAMKKNIYDACFIIDADCYMDNKCMEELNNALSTGKQIIQVKKRVKNFYMKNKNANSLWSSCNGLIWTIIDDLGNKYKSAKGITNMLIGTGIMIRMDVIKELNGWPYNKTLTEDIEFMNDAAIKGYSTFYYEHAIIYLEESTSLKVTNKRRTRWMDGVINSKRIYNDRLKEASDKNRYFVTALSPCFLFIGACLLYFVLNMIIGGVLFFAGSSLWTECFMLGLISMGIIYVSFFILTLFILMVGHIKRPWYEKILLLFIHPIFYMGYIRICLKVYLGLTSNKWEVIDRVKFEG